ncbi:MAG TPA: serine/threonine-protein kinase [Roseiflexaceae bacterium]|nr:serine/threonine-protein kinase [Roseiflexaceae bacterium]
MARATPLNSGKSMAEVVVLCPICRKPNPRTLANIRRAHFCQHCGHDIVLNDPGPSYFITRVIKEGGQGAVYQAIGEDERTYAVKEMLDRFTDPKERAESTTRFQAEANLLQRLTHPRIPRVFAHFEDEGRHYLTMEYVYGEDLEQILERDERLPEARVLTMADQICDVLTYLHTQRPPIIFRDMKPSNVMVERDGGIKVVDFGIAKLFQRAERGTQIGTPGYAPPEQYQGLATVESDIYALGATLHHMLTGRDPRDEPPFSFPPVRQLAPQVSERTAQAIERALQMDPDNRFHTVADFRAALNPPVARPQPAQRPTATPGRPARPTPAPARVPQQQPAPAFARPAPAPAAPIPVPASQPAQARPVSAGGCIASIVRFMITLVVLLALAVGALWYFAPDVVNGYLPASSPTAGPTLGPVITQMFSADNLEATVPANATDQQIRQAFIDKLTAAAQARYGASARVNTSTFGYKAGGSPQQVSTAPNGDVTYRASAQAFIQAPQSGQ